MNRTFFAIIGILAVSAVCAKEQVANVVNISKLGHDERAKLKEVFARYEGGRIGKPGTKKGKIVYINDQQRVRESLIKEQISEINSKLNYDIEVVQGRFTLPSPKLEAEANLFVVDDPALPSLLSAPENRWVMVNVAGLTAGAGQKPQFFEAREKKALTRGFCLLAGAQDSGFKMSLMECMTKPEQLDLHIDCRLPVDVIKRFSPYLEGYGIKPEKIVSYRKACEEGWAPAPTNEIQKVVWDEIHALPTDPIKIKPETTKQK